MSQEELGQAGPSWMKNSTMMNDELLNDDEKFYNDENELLNDEGKFYNQKSRNMMVPKNEFRHHKIAQMEMFSLEKSEKIFRMHKFLQ